jgi:murein DD-endopeptidase MepM/ murein hydrolase activator NlpD
MKMKTVETALAEMNEEANHVRLMVDLPVVDRATSTGGIGGAIVQPEYSASSDNTTQLLRSASSLLSQLGSEMKVQQQSYEEIAKRIDYNKDYFAAMPALKPMDGYYSTNGFGLRMHPVLGIFKTHEGLDIVNDVGTPVVAAGNGIVEVAGQSGGGYGTVVVIKHGFGFQTLYAHLSKTLVREGQHVKRGDLIGKSGRTGLVTGPHLHYEVRYNGVCKNPVDYFLDDVTPQYYRSQIASR